VKPSAKPSKRSYAQAVGVQPRRTGYRHTPKDASAAQRRLKPPRFKKLTVKERKELLESLEGKKSTRPSVPAPKPVAERSVEELYTLLLSTWTRYKVVLTKKDGQPRVALDNVRKIHDLLISKGEPMENVITFLQSHMEGGE
jgi:hypothetical protein